MNYNKILDNNNIADTYLRFVESRKNETSNYTDNILVRERGYSDDRKYLEDSIYLRDILHIDSIYQSNEDYLLGCVLFGRAYLSKNLPNTSRNSSDWYSFNKIKLDELQQEIVKMFSNSDGSTRDPIENFNVNRSSYYNMDKYNYVKHAAFSDAALKGSLLAWLTYIINYEIDPTSSLFDEFIDASNKPVSDGIKNWFNNGLEHHNGGAIPLFHGVLSEKFKDINQADSYINNVTKNNIDISHGNVIGFGNVIGGYENNNTQEIYGIPYLELTAELIKLALKHFSHISFKDGTELLKTRLRHTKDEVSILKDIMKNVTQEVIKDNMEFLESKLRGRYVINNLIETRKINQIIRKKLHEELKKYKGFRFVNFSIVNHKRSNGLIFSFRTLCNLEILLVTRYNAPNHYVYNTSTISSTSNYFLENRSYENTKMVERKSDVLRRSPPRNANNYNFLNYTFKKYPNLIVRMVKFDGIDANKLSEKPTSIYVKDAVKTNHVFVQQVNTADPDKLPNYFSIYRSNVDDNIPVGEMTQRDIEELNSYTEKVNGGLKIAFQEIQYYDKPVNVSNENIIYGKYKSRGKYSNCVVPYAHTFRSCGKDGNILQIKVNDNCSPNYFNMLMTEFSLNNMKKFCNQIKASLNEIQEHQWKQYLEIVLEASDKGIDSARTKYLKLIDSLCDNELASISEKLEINPEKLLSKICVKYINHNDELYKNIKIIRQELIHNLLYTDLDIKVSYIDYENYYYDIFKNTFKTEDIILK